MDCSFGLLNCICNKLPSHPEIYGSLDWLNIYYDLNHDIEVTKMNMGFRRLLARQRLIGVLHFVKRQTDPNGSQGHWQKCSILTYKPYYLYIFHTASLYHCSISLFDSNIIIRLCRPFDLEV